MDAEQPQEAPEAMAETQPSMASPEDVPEKPCEPAETAALQQSPEPTVLLEKPPEKSPEVESSPGKLGESERSAEKSVDPEKSPEKLPEPEKSPEKFVLDPKVETGAAEPPVPEVEQKVQTTPELQAPEPEPEPTQQLSAQPEKPGAAAVKEAESQEQEAEAVKGAEPEKPAEAVVMKEAESTLETVKVGPTEAEPEKQEAEAVKEAETTPEAEPAKPVEAEVAKTEQEGEKPKGEGQKEAEQAKEAALPLFFGWFLLPEVQERITCSTMDFLKTLDTLDAFKKHLSEFTGGAEQEVDLEQYFQVKGPLHCTAYFCDYGKAEGAKEYAAQPVVKESCGGVSELSLSALFVTPRAFGARVALTPEQLALWPAGADAQGAPTSAEAMPAGSRAHVTLGCAAGVEPVQTGADLLDLLLARRGAAEGGAQVEELELGSLSYLGQGRWYLALREPVAAEATFSSYSDDKPLDNGKKEVEKKKKPKCTIL